MIDSGPPGHTLAIAADHLRPESGSVDTTRHNRLSVPFSWFHSIECGPPHSCAWEASTCCAPLTERLCRIRVNELQRKLTLSLAGTPAQRSYLPELSGATVACGVPV